MSKTRLVTFKEISDLSDPVAVKTTITRLETLIDSSDPILVLKEIKWVRDYHISIQMIRKGYLITYPIFTGRENFQIIHGFRFEYNIIPINLS